MGKILNIRVMAQTYNENDVAKAWPRLASLAWPEWSAKLGLEAIDDSLPGYSTGESVVEKALGARKHGVMELAGALPDLLNFSDLPDNILNALAEPVARADKARRGIDAALGDWDVKTAAALTFELEEALSAAEKSLAKIK